MKFSALCPISEKKVHAFLPRINATITFSLLSAYLFTGSIFIPLLLALDFLLRASDFGKYSLISITSHHTIKLFEISGSLINAGPKLFAARIGFLFAISITVAQLAGFVSLAQIIAVVLALFSFLEAAFGFCLACEIYPFVYRLAYRNKMVL
ncbi:MAG: DUF4395 domain-containing protein [Bacteroidales bacterium]